MADNVSLVMAQPNKNLSNQQDTPAEIRNPKRSTL